MPAKSTDIIGEWFIAAEELGEYIGIRFGHIAPGTDQPEWTFLSHRDFAGIGGLAYLMRQGGADLDRLAQMKYPGSPSRWALIRALPKFLRPRRHVKWSSIEGGPSVCSNSQPPSAVAWHCFDEYATTQIRRACRKAGVTVNSFLLKHLTKAIRPSLQDQSSMVPWMVPVNLRGKIVRDRDTSNYSSYIGVRVQSYETVQDVHTNIYAALRRGEHWANWSAYKLGRFLTGGMLKFLISKELCMSQWNLGGFSNLGDWDPDKKLKGLGSDGVWLFCPPVLRCQVVGAGCVTFRNKLSLTLQIHPDMATRSEVAKGWITNWVKEIDMDLSSFLEESPAVPWLAA